MTKQKALLPPLVLLSVLLVGCFEKDQNRLFVHTQNTTYRDGILVAAVPRPNQHVHGDWRTTLRTLPAPSKPMTHGPAPTGALM